MNQGFYVSGYRKRHRTEAKKKMFLSCNVLEKNRAVRSVKKVHYFFGKKCVFYACFLLNRSWEGGKKIRGGIF